VLDLLWCQSWQFVAGIARIVLNMNTSEHFVASRFFLFHLKAIAICSCFNPKQPRASEAFGRSKLVGDIGEGGVMS